MNIRKNNCSVITVNYNSFLYTENLLFSLRMSDCKEDSLYIIDNFALFRFNFRSSGKSTVQTFSSDLMG